jgi:hypothetical protein
MSDTLEAIAPVESIARRIPRDSRYFEIKREIEEFLYELKVD